MWADKKPLAIHIYRTLDEEENWGSPEEEEDAHLLTPDFESAYYRNPSLSVSSFNHFLPKILFEK